MRIAVWHNLPSGGGKRALYNQVKGLIERGHHVECWCPPTADLDYLPLAALVPEHIVPYEKKPPLRHWPWDRLNAYQSWKSRFAAINEHCRTCGEQMNAAGFDVLFAGNCRENVLAPIALHVRIPRLLYHQEPNRDFYEARPKLPWVAPPKVPAASFLRKAKDFVRDFDALTRVRVEAREEKISAGAFDLILSNSAFSRESILRSYGLDSKVCYLGIDNRLFKPSNVRRENYVIGLGGIERHKGIEALIEALGTLPAKRIPKLIWIGNLLNSAYQDEMQKLATEKGVSLTIKRLVKDPDLVDGLCRAAMMVYAPRLEPFGFAPLEANACGTPVVAVAEGGVRETIIHGVNGLLVADRDPKAFGLAILRLLDEPELAHRLGQTGVERVQQMWTWAKSVESLECHLASIVK